MVVIGTVGMVVAARKGQPKAIWVTIGFFTAMEALQTAGYFVVDRCTSPTNISITNLSYLHIVLQPLFINAFAMATAPRPVPSWLRRVVWGLAGLATLSLLARMLPLPALGSCTPGAPFCGAETCTISGEWHIAWALPLNGLFESAGAAFGLKLWFPVYNLAVFLLPLAYGAWRFTALNFVLGPIAARFLTSNPTEQLAIWCLFSVAILLIALSPFVRHRLVGAHRES